MASRYALSRRARELVAIWRERPLHGDAIWFHRGPLPSGGRFEWWIILW